MTEPAERLVPANGLHFQTLQLGEGDRLALCLHGFPSLNRCWRHQLPLLAGLGYRAWAPNLRGYGGSSRPGRVADYALDRLLEDVAGLIDASGARSTVLIGHDWGALVAWFFAARRVRPLDALVVMNVPHPACAAVAFRRLRQLRKSWYIAAAQLPWLPEALLCAGRAWLLGSLMRGSARSDRTFPPAMLDRYRAAAARPGAARAMLDWYRALLRTPFPPEMRGDFPIIQTRTLVIWGEEDVALDISGLDGTERYVPDLTIRRLPGVSHWVQEEAPETVNALIEAFLTGREVPRP